MQKEKFLGHIKLQDLYQKNNKILKHFIKQSMVFKPLDSIALALSMMKEKNEIYRRCCGRKTPRYFVGQ